MSVEQERGSRSLHSRGGIGEEDSMNECCFVVPSSFVDHRGGCGGGRPPAGATCRRGGRRGVQVVLRGEDGGGCGVVWVWRELRLADQPALYEAARQEESIAVLFVADNEVRYRREKGDYVGFLGEAVETMREELRKKGSELFVRTGNAAEEVAKFARDVKATSIYATENSDSLWHDRLKYLQTRFDGRVQVLQDAYAVETESLGPPNERNTYSRWRKLKTMGILAVNRPPPSLPDTLPPPPTIAETNEEASTFPGALLQASAPYLFDREREDDLTCNASAVTARDLITRPESCLPELVSSRRDIFRSLQEALQFGSVSLWQLHEAGAQEEARAKGWHRSVALFDSAQNRKWRYWLWRGCLVRYDASGPLSDRTAPAVLFVHGFGASSQHFTDNMSGLAQEGLRVYALDMLGFGKTEKPMTFYTQNLWEAQIASFVREIVGHPVYVVGNSIGGYMSMSFAADHCGSLCKGVVLLNSAGSIGNPPKPMEVQQETKDRNDSIILLATSLLPLAQSQIRSILLRLYPVNPEEVTDELVANILRDSTDPGAAYVLESGSRLPRRRTLEELFEIYDGPLLLLQGRLDPLNEAEVRARKIAAAYEKAELLLLEAGHCPHDEVPSAVNESILAWVNRTEEQQLHTKATSGGTATARTV